MPRRAVTESVYQAQIGNYLRDLRGEQLARFRVEAGLTQAQAARLLGISERTVRRRETECPVTAGMYGDPSRVSNPPAPIPAALWFPTHGSEVLADPPPPEGKRPRRARVRDGDAATRSEFLGTPRSLEGRLAARAARKHRSGRNVTEDRVIEALDGRYRNGRRRGRMKWK